MKILPFKGLFPKTDWIASTDTFFSTTKFQFPEYYANNFFEKDEEKAIYIYRIENHKSSSTGIVSSIDLKEIVNGKVVPHEKTIARKEQEQLNLIIQRKAFIKPVLLAYQKTNKALQEIINTNTKKPCHIQIQLKKGQISHSFWKIRETASIKKIQEIFASKIKKVYIADGHHRCSTASLLWSRRSREGMKTKVSSLISLLIPFEELDIFDYNRVVNIDGITNPSKFIASLSKFCKIEVFDRNYKPEKKHELSMFIEEDWYKIKWKKSVLEEYKSLKHVLDHSILNDIVFNKILGIEDVKYDASLSYVPGTEKWNGVIKKVMAVPSGVGFMLYPINEVELRYHADNDIALPPKSTYFEPRMLNGLLSEEI